MGLSDQRRLFIQIRSKCQVIVSNHAWRDYPERGFSKLEIVNLVRFGKGTIRENRSPTAIKGSFLFLPKDELDRQCKLVLLIEEIEIEPGVSETIIVCSAYREVSHETAKN